MAGDPEPSWQGPSKPCFSQEYKRLIESHGNKLIICIILTLFSLSLYVYIDCQSAQKLGTISRLLRLKVKQERCVDMS